MATPAAFPFMTMLVETYRRSYPEAPDILVNVGSLDEAWNRYDQGTAQGVAALDGAGAQYQTSSLGWAGIAIVAASGATSENLTQDQVRSLFLGIPGASAAGGAAHPFVYPAEDDLQQLFNQMALDGQLPYSGATLLPHAVALSDALSTDPSGIGFMACIDMPSQLMKYSIDGVYPDYESVIKGIYPFRAPILVSAKSEMPAGLQSFIDWAQSTQGQAVLAQACPTGEKS
jgi:ABC-type phosphate transport system substrate-binding protein